MSFLVDTNVLLRSIEPLHPQHNLAVDAISALLSLPGPVYFSHQNIAEFWNVATRPKDKNGLGFSVDTVLREVGQIERFLTLLPDTPTVYASWKRLVVHYRVSGAKVHDARLVAIMQTHGITELLTFNVDDFVRYSEIVVHHPESVGI